MWGLCVFAQHSLLTLLLVYHYRYFVYWGMNALCAASGRCESAAGFHWESARDCHCAGQRVLGAKKRPPIHLNLQQDVTENRILGTKARSAAWSSARMRHCRSRTRRPRTGQRGRPCSLRSPDPALRQERSRARTPPPATPDATSGSLPDNRFQPSPGPRRGARSWAGCV